jgi:DNA polymerase II small subunit
MDKEILEAIKENGLLLEKEVFDLVNCFTDKKTAKDFLEKLEKVSGQKFLTKSVLNKNYEYVKSEISKMGDSSLLEKVRVNLGLSVEITSHKEIIKDNSAGENKALDYSVFYANTRPDKKLEVKDFVGHFRARFQQMQRILMGRRELQNLVSIGKISSDRTSLSIIGIVTEKRITKNKNLIIKFEDLTGTINALVKFDRKEIFDKGEELQLDEIVGVKASGNKDLLFVHDIIFPDAIIHEKTRFIQDVNIGFLSDIHAGGEKHLGKSFEKFLEWVNSKDEAAMKIKYLFFVGDNVDGVGIFPGQEETLSLKSMNEQYALLADYLSKVPKRITMFMCPGQHDASRVAEPQPIIDKKYARKLYELDNLVLVTNPAMIKLREGDKEFKVLMYHGGSLHSFINEIKELREIKAHNCPAKAGKHMLKRRHLAPSHGISSSLVYIPNADFDPLVISEVPDVLTTGEVHRVDIESYNGILIIANSCWQGQTSFEESIGNIPDPCKVPVLNLKTRELKIYNFAEEEEELGH